MAITRSRHKLCNKYPASSSSTSNVSHLRTHKKRPRFHMEQPGVKKKKSIQKEVERLIAAAAMDDNISDYDRMFNRIYEVCVKNENAYIRHLLSGCVGEVNMGSPYKPLEFWPIFTETFVRILKLDIEVKPAAVAACKIFGIKLKALSKKMEKTSKEMAKCRRDQSLEPPPEIKQELSILFGKQPRFSGGSSGSSSKSPRSSKSARPSKSPLSMSRDASVSDARGPSPASEFQKKKVEEAVSQMVTDKVLHLSDLYDVVSCFSSCEATATLFLGFSSTDRLSEVNTFLLTKKRNRQIYS